MSSFLSLHSNPEIPIKMTEMRMERREHAVHFLKPDIEASDLIVSQTVHPIAGIQSHKN